MFNSDLFIVTEARIRSNLKTHKNINIDMSYVLIRDTVFIGTVVH